jgi:hypothetical protein
MKNPMDRQLEKRISDRAVAIGREGEVAAVGELLELLKSSAANARRLAASELGKLAWMGVDQQEGKRLISIYPADLPRLGVLLAAKLRMFGYAVSGDERSKVSGVGQVDAARAREKGR